MARDATLPGMRGRGDGTLASAGKVPNKLGFTVRGNSGVIGVLVVWWWPGGCQGLPTDPLAGDRVDLGSIGAGYRLYKQGGSGIDSFSWLLGLSCVVHLVMGMISGLYLAPCPSYLGNCVCTSSSLSFELCRELVLRYLESIIVISLLAQIKRE